MNNIEKLTLLTLYTSNEQIGYELPVFEDPEGPSANVLFEMIGVLETAKQMIIDALKENMNED